MNIKIRIRLIASSILTAFLFLQFSLCLAQQATSDYNIGDKIWITKIPSTDNGPLFPNRFGNPLTRSGVRQRLLVAQQQATKQCPSLSERRITPHTLRHTTAMHLLQSGVDLSVIALWLGHEQIGTTHQYMEANLDMKKAALKSLDPIKSGSVERFKKPSDSVLAFLESL